MISYTIDSGGIMIPNPCKLKAFSFLEFSAPDDNILHQQFQHMGFNLSQKHTNKPMAVYQQDQITFLVNSTKNSQAEAHAKTHGAGACAMGFEVENVESAYTHLLSQGAKSYDTSEGNQHGLPAIHAIGGSIIYLTDSHHRPFQGEWVTHDLKSKSDAGLTYIDHLTHNVYRGNMDKWAGFYETLFNFKEIRYFDIKGSKTGLVSRALASPTGEIKIPLNESKDDYSQIEEFLHDYHGEGIQHIALHTSNIYQSIKNLRQQQIHFLDVPDTYYEMLPSRLPWHQEPVSELQKLKLLIDGEATPEKGLLLQIFTENTFGPVFFEIIQRKGNEGFGEGNFQALFEAIERDQIKRGTLK